MSSILPEIEIDEDDPRYAELKRIEHEARIRYAKSDEARLDALAITDPNRIRPGWKLVNVKPKPPFKVIPWDK